MANKQTKTTHSDRPTKTVLSATERLAWLRLSRTENVGPITFFQLLQQYKTAEAALEALPEIALRGGRKTGLRVPSVAECTREEQQHASIKGSLMTFADDAYPDLLRSVPDAPPVLSVRGSLDYFNKPTVGIVGARNASLNGRKFAQQLARELAEAGFHVCSGLARGIDTAAHQGSLFHGPIAVIAGGVDHIYPPENEALYHEIAARGAIVSESRFGTTPNASLFPRRNRLISGMSLAVIVVEAAKQSGSLITARMALEQGREVLAVPGSPIDPRSQGCNLLIRQGATLIQSTDDVLQALERPYHLPSGTEPAYVAEPTPALGEQERAKIQTKLLECLSPSPIQMDELVRDLACPTAVIVTILLELELAGRVMRHPGNQVSRIMDWGSDH